MPLDSCSSSDALPFSLSTTLSSECGRPFLLSLSVLMMEFEAEPLFLLCRRRVLERTLDNPLDLDVEGESDMAGVVAVDYRNGGLFG